MTKRNFGLNMTTPKLWRYGSELLREDQGMVLMIWEGQRYILDSEPPRWAYKTDSGTETYPPQFASDIDWLAHTRFATTMNGRLDKRVRECQEEPTWPTRPDLVGASIGEQAALAPNLRFKGWARQRELEKRVAAAELTESFRGLSGVEILRIAQERALAREAAGLPPEEDD